MPHLLCYRSDRLEPNSSGSRGQESDCRFECKLLCCKCSYCHRVATKERRKSHLLSNVHRNKICERCFLCRSLEFCKSCHQCPTCCYSSSCRGKATQVLGEMGSPGCESKSSHHTERGLYPPLLVQTQLGQVTYCNKQLPEPSETNQPLRGTVSSVKQKCSRTGGKSKLPGVLQPTIFGTQTRQPVETHPRPEHLEHLFGCRVVQDRDPRDHKNLPTGRGVGHIHSIPKQVFNFVGYQFNLIEGKVRPTVERWQALTNKIQSILSGPVCPVRQFMSLIGLFTATEKQVHLGRLHMRPIHWHLKNNWRVPESLDKVITVYRSLHPHLRWWLEESNVLQVNHYTL